MTALDAAVAAARKAVPFTNRDAVARIVETAAPIIAAAAAAAERDRIRQLAEQQALNVSDAGLAMAFRRFADLLEATLG